MPSPRISALLAVLLCAACTGERGSLESADASAGPPRELDASSWGDAASSESAACVEYMRAQCERKAECGLYGSFEACFFDDVSLCPDYLFSPGSTRSIEGTSACAAAWRDAPCDDVRRDLPLACATPGTREPGESCVSGPQCKSRVCSGRLDACGMCRAVVGDGERCVAGLLICELGFTCDPELALCVRYVVPPLRPDREPLPLGAECQGNDCGSHRCARDGEGIDRCTPYPRRGESCRASKACAPDDDSYCDTSETCLVKPEAGQPCGVDAFTGMASWCAEGSSCDRDAEPPRCRALPGLGEACFERCAGEASCLCDDPSCSARHCALRRAPGEPCDLDAFEGCVEGVSECRDGRCELVDSQRAFARLCAP